MVELKTEAVSFFDVQPVTARELVVRAGERLLLSEVMTPEVRSTTDVALFKQWIGTDDRLIEEHPMEGLPELPSREWPENRVADPAVLSAEEWADLQRAAKAYLFGHSKLVESYKPAIEVFFGPFEADVYVLDRLVLEPGATLIVDRRPVSLLIDSVTLHPGAAIRLHTIAKLWIRHCEKIAGR